MVESKWWECNSRVLTGQAMSVIELSVSCCPSLGLLGRSVNSANFPNQRLASSEDEAPGDNLPGEDELEKLEKVA